MKIELVVGSEEIAEARFVPDEIPEILGPEDDRVNGAGVEVHPPDMGPWAGDLDGFRP
jgi:hypothetical protein